MLRAAYLDLDGALLGRGGSLFHDGDGAFTMLGARALEACARADVEVVPWSARGRAEVAADARLLGVRSFVFDAGRGVVLDGEAEPPHRLGTPADAIAWHMRARGYAPEACIAVAGPGANELAGVVGGVWVARGAGGPANARVAEAAHGAAVYEAVITELAERR